MSSNWLRLDCVPNTAICGNGVVETGEECEDGNTQGCDGCSPTCRHESCGNGVIDCDEQCDAGVPNPPPGTGCTASCTEVAPALRIPGGGGRPIDCTLEWAVALHQDRITLDGRGVPKNRQDCVDGDPACDFDPTAGACHLRVFACLGGPDARLGCAASGVAAAAVVRPKVSDPGLLRDALVHALGELPFPLGPGEECTRAVGVDLPVGKKGLVLKLSALRSDGKQDRDSLKLRCLAPRVP